jgi:serine/threonine protein kinase
MEPSALQQGTIVDRYTVEAVLGEGGMAIVYRVRHNVLGTVHALKVLTMSSRQIRERLRQEGQFQAKLQHPNIVAVTDVIDLGGAPGLIMEYIDGPSLDELIRRGPLTFDQVDELAAGIFAGVGEAHRQGFVHRDLKPGNVLLKLTERGLVPKVADFGLAKAMGGSDPGHARTRTGSTMGTPHYMSPEQVRDAKNVGARSDIFALGAILYEMVAGRRAFDGEDLLDIFNAIAQGRYVPLRERVADAPERMERAIAAALQTSPEARPASAEELASLWRGGAPLAPLSQSAFDVSTMSLPRFPPPTLSTGAETAPSELGPSATWTGGSLPPNADRNAEVRAVPVVPAISSSRTAPSARAVWALGLGGGVFAVFVVAAVCMLVMTSGLALLWGTSGGSVPSGHASSPPPVAAVSPAPDDVPEPAAAPPEVAEDEPLAAEPAADKVAEAPELPEVPEAAAPVLGETVAGEAGVDDEDAVAVVDPEEEEEEPVAAQPAATQPGAAQPAAPEPAGPAPTGKAPRTPREPELTPFLASPDPGERRKGIDNLAARPQDDDALRLLDYMVRNEKDGSIRGYAWSVVLSFYQARKGNVALLERTVVWQMGHDPARDAVAAVNAFGRWGAEPERLKGAIAHTDRDVRMAVVKALPEVARRAREGVDYATLVAPLLHDVDPDVKRKAEQALSGL